MNTSRKWIIFIFSLFFSFILWIWVSLEDENKAFIKVKVETINLPKGKVLLDLPPHELDVQFSGAGHQLAAMYLNPNLKCEINLLGFDKDNHILFSKENIQKMIKMPSGVQLIEVYPDTIRISLDDYAEKRVPLKSNIRVNCGDGYTVVGAVDINPSNVKISGPKSILQTIDYWNTAYNEYNDVREDISSIFPLSDSLKNIIKLSNETVWIDIHVQMFAEQEYKDIPIVLENFPNNHQIYILPSMVDIMVRSGVDILATFDPNQLKIIIDYKQIEKDTSGYLKPEALLPESLELVKLTPTKVQYIIRE